MALANTDYVQLPPDSTGKKSAFKAATIGGATIYVPASVLYDESGAYAATIFPAGFLRVTDEPTQLFYDPFDGAVVDVTNRWTSSFALGAAVAPAQASGSLTVNAGATAGGWASLGSQAALVPTVPSWLGASFANAFTDGAAFVSTGTRFWGVGTIPGTPTTAVPITDGIGFEISSGKMYAVVYAAGVRTQIADLSAATGTGTAPTDTANHRYIVYIRTDRVFWYIDSLSVPVAVSNFQSPQVQTLPIRYVAVSGGSATTIGSAGLAAWDTGKNNTQLSDGTFPWRKAAISATGAISVDTELPAAAALADAAAVPTTPIVGAADLAFNGATLDRVRTIDAFKTAAAAPDVGLLSAVATDRRFTAVTLAAAVASQQTWDTNGAVDAIVTVAATTTGTMIFEVTNDGTNWTTAEVYDGAAELWVPGAVTPTAAKNYRIITAGWRTLRARVVTLLGATVNLVVTLSSTPALVRAVDTGPAPHQFGYTQQAISAQYTGQATSVALLTVAATQFAVVTYVQIQAGGTTAGTLWLYYGTGSYSRGTNKAIFDGEFAPSATLKPGFSASPPNGLKGALDDDIRVTTNAAMTVTVTVWYYLVG